MIRQRCIPLLFIFAVFLIPSHLILLPSAHAEIISWQDTLSLFDGSGMTSEEKEQVSRLYARGNELVRRQEFSLAEREFLEAVKMAPKNALLHHSLGLVYVHLGDMQAALHYFNEAVALDPRQFKSFYALGKIYAGQNDVEKSASAFRKAIELSPGNRDAYHDLAKVYYTNQRWEEALDVLLESESILGDSPETLTLIGITSLRSGRTDVVIEIITQLKSKGELERARNLETALRQVRSGRG